ncbi:MAG: PQQ-dependent sugar dehydrogenase [Chitinophagaceae bacterium]
MKETFTSLKKIRLLFSTLIIGITLHAQPPALDFASIVTGLSFPVDIVNAGDGSNRLFIAQHNGVIRIYSGSNLLPQPFIDLSGVTTENGEQGFLSIAFHPQYATNRNFFVLYTATGTGNVTLARYTTSLADANVADLASGVILLSLPKPAGRTNHNGGKLNFGSDGYLYLGTGDGGGGGDPDNLAQNGNSYLGKLLRINVTNVTTAPYYTIPADNPFVSDPAILDEIYSFGLRNPWRWSFDRQTHDLWIADVGQSAWEEVNFVAANATAGINYGWRCYEGTHEYNTTGCLPIGNYTSPIFEYPHNNATGGFSITGGYVYRGPDYPALTGYYICADYISGNVWKVGPDGDGGWTATIQAGLPGSLTGFGEAENGALYAVSSAGALYRVQASASLPVTLVSFTGRAKEGIVTLDWKTSFEQDNKSFEVEYSQDGTTFQRIGIVQAIGSANGAGYNYLHTVPFNGMAYYRLKIIEQSGTWTYSSIISLQVNEVTRNRVYPTVVSNGMLSLQLDGSLQTVKIVSTDGKAILQRDLRGRSGRVDLAIPVVPKGMYLVQLLGAGQPIVQKIIIE